MSCTCWRDGHLSREIQRGVDTNKSFVSADIIMNNLKMLSRTLTSITRCANVYICVYVYIWYIIFIYCVCMYIYIKRFSRERMSFVAVTQLKTVSKTSLFSYLPICNLHRFLCFYIIFIKMNSSIFFFFTCKANKYRKKNTYDLYYSILKIGPTKDPKLIAFELRLHWVYIIITT